MTVGELLDELNFYRRDEQIALYSPGNKRMSIDRVDHERASSVGCVCLQAKWTTDEGDPMEYNLEELEKARKKYESSRESAVDFEKRITERLARLEKRVEPKRPRTRTKAQQIAAGFVPTGKRGRPCKIETVIRREEEARARREELIRQGINPDAPND